MMLEKILKQELNKKYRKQVVEAKDDTHRFSSRPKRY